MVSAFTPIGDGCDQLKCLTLTAQLAHGNDDAVFICCIFMYFPSTVTISQWFSDDDVCLCYLFCLLCFLMKHCNLVKWLAD